MTARIMIRSVGGSRPNAFTLDRAKREATNFCVWESEAAARAFFTDELVDRVTALYGAYPTVEFVEIAALVENARSR